jgi:hypothetical protein
VTANIIILEEAAFTDEQMFQTVIVPLLGVGGTALIGISTPSGELDNYYTRLMDMKDSENEQKTMFKTIRISLSCEACKVAKKAADCTHMTHLLPSWKSSERQRKMKRIMGQEALFMQENMGLMADTTDYVFCKKRLKALRLAPERKWRSSPSVLYCAVDPGGGGAMSDYSMVTVGYQNGRYLICGADSTPSSEADTVDRMIYDHILELRSNRVYGKCVIVLYIESNYSWVEADRVAKICSAYPLRPVYVETSKHGGSIRPGVLTTKDSKTGYMFATRQLLQCDNLSFAKAFVSSHPEDVKNALIGQLEQFRKVTKVPKDAEFGTTQVTYTGKSFNSKDDLAMALMMAIYFSFATRASKPFLEIAERNGWVIN